MKANDLISVSDAIKKNWHTLEKIEPTVLGMEEYTIIVTNAIGASNGEALQYVHKNWIQAKAKTDLYEKCVKAALALNQKALAYVDEIWRKTHLPQYISLVVAVVPALNNLKDPEFKEWVYGQVLHAYDEKLIPSNSPVVAEAYNFFSQEKGIKSKNHPLMNWITQTALQKAMEKYERQQRQKQAVFSFSPSKPDPMHQRF